MRLPDVADRRSHGDRRHCPVSGPGDAGRCARLRGAGHRQQAAGPERLRPVDVQSAARGAAEAAQSAVRGAAGVAATAGKAHARHGDAAQVRRSDGRAAAQRVLLEEGRGEDQVSMSDINGNVNKYVQNISRSHLY